MRYLMWHAEMVSLLLVGHTIGDYVRNICLHLIVLIFLFFIIHGTS